MWSPIAVGVEVNASEEEGWRRLGVFTAAWHRRMRHIMLQMPHTRGERVVTLPLLLIVGHDWRLGFAVDAGGRIDIFTCMRVGGTDSIAGIYMIAAVLRHLAGWVAGPFREWITMVFAPRQASPYFA
ncbi:hypothetical protein RB598_000166 [Gaeumannomyces tritici]